MTNRAGAGQKPWTSRAAKLLEMSESVVLVLIGVALVLVAVLLLYSSMYDLNEAVRHGPGEIEHKAIEILNTVLLVMMTMEIVYTVAHLARVAHPQRRAVPDHWRNRRHPADAGDYGDLDGGRGPARRNSTTCWWNSDCWPPRWWRWPARSGYSATARTGLPAGNRAKANSHGWPDFRLTVDSR